jgi:hypothetical protein
MSNPLNPLDFGIDITDSTFAGSADLFEAIEVYLSVGGDLYLTKMDYQLARGCDTIEFFTNILMYDMFSLESGASSLGHVPYPGLTVMVE